MDKLTELQGLKMALVKDMNWNIDKAKEVWNWVIGETSMTPDTTSNVSKPDGIYFVMPDGVCIHQSVVTVDEKKRCVAVGVKMGDKFANVVLQDANDGEDVALCESDCTTNRYLNRFVDAISDWDGQGNTAALKPYLNTEIGLEDGQYIPAVAELHLILLNIKAVNDALIEVGGQQMRNVWYWSSTELNSNGAWYVYFHSGTAASGNKCSSLAVRPSVACELSL